MSAFSKFMKLFSMAGGVRSQTNPLTGGISFSFSGAKIPASVFGEKSAFNFLNRPTCMVFGNSISRQSQPSYSTAGQVIAYSVYWWAMGFAGWPFRFVRTGAKRQIGADSNSQLSYGIYGYSGANSVTLQPYFDSVIVPNAPQYCFMQCMENDVVAIAAGTVTRAQVIAAYAAMIASAKSAGIRLIWNGCLPSLSYDNATGVSASLHSTEYWALTEYIEGLAASDLNLIYVPVADLYMDTTTAGLPKPVNAGSFANWVDASVHPQKAAVWIGKRISDVLSLNGIRGFMTLPRSGSSHNIFSNSLMQGSSGTVSTGYIGSCPSSLTVQNDLTNPTGTASLVVVDGRQCLQVDVTAGAQTGIKNILQINPTSSPSSGFAVGDYVQAFAEIELRSETTPVGVRLPQFNLVFNGGGGTVGATNIMSDTWGMDFPTNTRFMLATPEIAVTAGTTSISPQMFWKATSGAASVAAKMRVHQLALVDSGQ